MPEKVSVFGIGNPLMDFVVQGDERIIQTLGAKKGTMQLITDEEKDKLLSSIHTYQNIPGGSCANTLRGIAWLSKFKNINKTVYSGAVGMDHVGDQYISMMDREYGILPIIPRKNKATGICIAIVTPDYERTMFTYLGACEEYSEADTDNSILAAAEILHFTGYMWNRENEKRAIQDASCFCRENNKIISFDLADPLMVKFHKKDFIEWIPGYVDILFGNREEISMLTGKTGDDMDTVIAAGNFADIVVMKAGADGCFVNNKGRITKINGIPVKAIDTVGAGDSFASGFLYGVVRKMDCDTCARIANRLASSIVTVDGCDYSKLNQKDVLMLH